MIAARMAPKLDRAYVVITNSRDFGVTEDMCNDMMGNLIRVDLNMNIDETRGSVIVE